MNKINTEIQILSENLRALRAKEKLSKREFAERIGISRGSLNMLENAIIPKRLSIDFLFSINRSFGIRPSDMLLENHVAGLTGKKS